MPFFKEVEYQVKGNEFGVKMYLQVQKYFTRLFFFWHPKWERFERAFRRTLVPGAAPPAPRPAPAPLPRSARRSAVSRRADGPPPPSRPLLCAQSICSAWA